MRNRFNIFSNEELDNSTVEGQSNINEVTITDMIEAENNAVEINDEISTFEEHCDECVNAVNAVNELEQQVDENNTLIEEKPEDVTEEVVQVAQEQFYLTLSKLGDLSHYSINGRISRELNNNIPIEKLKITTEGVSDFLKKIKEKIIAMFRAIKDFFVRILQKIGIMKKTKDAQVKNSIDEFNKTMDEFNKDMEEAGKSFAEAETILARRRVATENRKLSKEDVEIAEDSTVDKLINALGFIGYFNYQICGVKNIYDLLADAKMFDIKHTFKLSLQTHSLLNILYDKGSEEFISYTKRTMSDSISFINDFDSKDKVTDNEDGIYDTKSQVHALTAINNKKLSVITLINNEEKLINDIDVVYYNKDNTKNSWHKSYINSFFSGESITASIKKFKERPIDIRKYQTASDNFSKELSKYEKTLEDGITYIKNMKLDESNKFFMNNVSVYQSFLSKVIAGYGMTFNAYITAYNSCINILNSGIKQVIVNIRNL